MIWPPALTHTQDPAERASLHAPLKENAVKIFLCLLPEHVRQPVLCEMMARLSQQPHLAHDLRILEVRAGLSIYI